MIYIKTWSTFLLKYNKVAKSFLFAFWNSALFLLIYKKLQSHFNIFLKRVLKYKIGLSDTAYFHEIRLKKYKNNYKTELLSIFLIVRGEFWKNFLNVWR